MPAKTKPSEPRWKRAAALGWTIARVPFHPAQVWPNKIRLRVCRHHQRPRLPHLSFPLTPAAASISLSTETRSAPPDRPRRHGRLPPRARPRAPRRRARPTNSAALLDDEPGLRGWYDALTESMRRETGKWILGAKSGEARMRRAEQIAERFLSRHGGRARTAAEHLQTAFRARPQARTGWTQMPQPSVAASCSPSSTIRHPTPDSVESETLRHRGEARKLTNHNRSHQPHTRISRPRPSPLPQHL